MDEKATLLLVDDEERILRSLKMLFRSQYTVRTTTDGAQALKILQNEPVHVLISDQRMPRMTGVELLRNAKQISPNTMRLLLTGYADMNAIIGSVNDGEIFRYIGKPWDAQEIKSKVSQAAEIALRLDAVSQKAYPRTRSSAPLPTPEGIGILVIDEDPATLAVVQEAVVPADRILGVSSMDSALQLLGKEEFDLVISELKFSAGDAAGVLKALKRHKSDLLSLVVTSFKDTSTLIELINEGQVFRFLPKPLTRNLLARSIEAGRRQILAQRVTPALLQRHQVDTPSPSNEGAKVSSRIMSYINRIRHRSTGTQAEF